MPNKNKEEYNKYMREYMRQRWETRRASAIFILGGRCVECLSLENLEFDHIDPEEKDFTIARGSSLSNEKFWKEIKKCQILCHSCHIDKHKSQAECGTVQRYWRGCKCVDCKAAYAKHHAEWKLSKDV